MLRREITHAGAHKFGLRVERMLGPERAVLVEGGYSIFFGYEVWVRLVGRYAYEIEDGLLRRAIVPRT
jgi:hypothetical protein